MQFFALKEAKHHIHIYLTWTRARKREREREHLNCRIQVNTIWINNNLSKEHFTLYIFLSLSNTILKQILNISRIRIPPGSYLHTCTISKHALQHSGYVLCVINAKMVTSEHWHLAVLYHSHHSRGLCYIVMQKHQFFFPFIKNEDK